MPHRDDTRILLQQWQSGDSTALHQLLERNLDWVRRRVERRLGSFLRERGEAADYVQDTMIQVLQYGPQFIVSDQAMFRALLAKIIENVLRSRFRWFHAARRGEQETVSYSRHDVLDLDRPRKQITRPSEIAVRAEGQVELHLAIDLLDAEDRDVVLLRQWEGLSFEDIAKTLSLTSDAARMRFRRALERLARTVERLRSGELQALVEGR